MIEVILIASTILNVLAGIALMTMVKKNEKQKEQLEQLDQSKQELAEEFEILDADYNALKIQLEKLEGERTIDDLLKAETLLKKQAYWIYKQTCQLEEQEEKLEQLEQSKEELEAEFDKAYRVTEEYNINFNNLTVEFNRQDQLYQELAEKFEILESELYNLKHALHLIYTRTDTATGAILNDDRFENSIDGVTRYKVYKKDHHTYIQRNDLSAFDRWSFCLEHEDSVKIARQLLRAVWTH
tara:strand:- start:630 stop:1352 length:723 start_codon:yes stop_codon:yes gene_type:complete